jgi:hypothetical protein
MLSKLKDKDERSRFSTRNFYSDIAQDEDEKSDDDNESEEHENFFASGKGGAPHQPPPSFPDNSDECNEIEDKDSDYEIEKPLNDTSKRHETKEPIKKRQTKMRDIKSIKPSLGFQGSSKNTSVPIKTNESASTRKSEREKTAKVRYDPTFVTPDDDDDLTNLDPDIQSHDQLMKTACY